jgi:hypothetical protein
MSPVQKSSACWLGRAEWELPLIVEAWKIARRRSTRNRRAARRQRHPNWDFGDLAQRARAIMGEKALHWHDWPRYSSWQHGPMNLGGIIETWRLTGDLSRLFQWLGLGKETVLGLGRYELIRDVV